MKLLRFRIGDRIACGVLEGDVVAEQEGDGPVRGRHALADVTLLAPCVPTKIVAVGLNYRDHAQEMGFTPPREPVIFLKPPTTLIGPGDVIAYPAMSSQVDYEAELGVVVKTRARNVPIADARDHILGYTCVNDVTARDLQKKDGQWTRAKSFDTFCPAGPWIETDLDPRDVAIEAYLNNKQCQASRTAQLLFPVDELVSFISRVMTLEPGDLILTGTPAGIGPMQPGDTIEVRIEGIGSLMNTLGPKDA